MVSICIEEWKQDQEWGQSSVYISKIEPNLLILMPDFGDSAAILNLVGIFSRWCELNFGLTPRQVKSRHFSERIGAWGQYSYKFLAIVS